MHAESPKLRGFLVERGVELESLLHRHITVHKTPDFERSQGFCGFWRLDFIGCAVMSAVTDYNRGLIFQ